MPISLPPRYDPLTGRLLPPACRPETPGEIALLAKLRDETAAHERREAQRWVNAVRVVQEENGIFFEGE